MSRLLKFFLIFILLSPVAYPRVEDVFKGQTSLKDPFSLRDPFQPPKFKSSAQRKNKQRARGILDNVPRLESDFKLENFEIVGVLIGERRRVVVKVENKTYTLKEGEPFGKGGPEIKAILPGGVILVEKITNIYGEDEFIETVVPISN